MRETKVWGNVWHIFQTANSAVSHLQLSEGFQCSRHMHAQRDNLFAVVAGMILVEVWRGETIQAVKLRVGESFVVPAGLYHRFKVLKSGEVIEIYSPAYPGAIVSFDDIYRTDVGGAFSVDIDKAGK